MRYMSIKLNKNLFLELRKNGFIPSSSFEEDNVVVCEITQEQFEALKTLKII